MRVLIVSFAFPPFNTIGAVRVGKMAKYLRQLGHEVRVLTAREQPWQRSLQLEIPEDEVVATGWLNVNLPVELLAGGRQRFAAEGFGGGARRPGLKGALGQLYKTLFHLPDAQIGWFGPALRGGGGLLERWRPDVILASSPPTTSLLVASRLAARFRVPWVADLRDLWTGNPYYPYPRWRLALEKRLERRVLRTAAGLVTVSEPLRLELAREYDVPTVEVLNGFDPADYPEEVERPSDGRLRIVYTGMLYGRRRDPSPLFRGIHMMRESDAVRLQFFGRYVAAAEEFAQECGVTHLVETHATVPYEESLRLQRGADALLLLPGNEPAAKGVYTGKFFEYLGARRPLVVVSDRDNVAATLVAERGLGIVETEPAAFAARLDEWVQRKRRGDGLPDLDPADLQGFTREVQARRLAGFLDEVVRG
jgi:glycosyltransferase involved in cell wall biosynthesis